MTENQVFNEIRKDVTVIRILGYRAMATPFNVNAGYAGSDRMPVKEYMDENLTPSIVGVELRVHEPSLYPVITPTKDFDYRIQGIGRIYSQFSFISAYTDPATYTVNWHVAEKESVIILTTLEFTMFALHRAGEPCFEFDGLGGQGILSLRISTKSRHKLYMPLVKYSIGKQKEVEQGLNSTIFNHVDSIDPTTKLQFKKSINVNILEEYREKFSYYSQFIELEGRDKAKQRALVEVVKDRYSILQDKGVKIVNVLGMKCWGAGVSKKPRSFANRSSEDDNYNKRPTVIGVEVEVIDTVFYPVVVPIEGYDYRNKEGRAVQRVFNHVSSYTDTSLYTVDWHKAVKGEILIMTSLEFILFTLEKDTTTYIFDYQDKRFTLDLNFIDGAQRGLYLPLVRFIIRENGEQVPSITKVIKVIDPGSDLGSIKKTPIVLLEQYKEKFSSYLAYINTDKIVPRRGVVRLKHLKDKLSKAHPHLFRKQEN